MAARPHATADHMTPSFAYLPRVLFGAVLVSALAGCASLPAPTGELAAAQQAVAQAVAADAAQYDASDLDTAQAALSQAQAAMSAGREEDARRLALDAAASGDLARARSRAAAAAARRAQRLREVAELQGKLKVDPDAPHALPDAPAEATGNYAARLQALAADPRLSGFAALERLQAQQAVDAAAAAHNRQRPDAEALAERRVRTAELSAYAQAVERDSDRLEAAFRELQLESSRRDAASARAEAEQLRMEAQLRAEEAERLRQQSATDAAARQQAEQALQGATSQQAARAGAARQSELALARQEAELVSGAKLPPLRHDARGDVYTFGGDAFPSGQTTLTPKALASLRALGAYLADIKAPQVHIDGFTDTQGDATANQLLSQRRADAVRKALTDAGVAASKMIASGHGSAQPIADNTTAAGRWKNRRVEISVEQKW